jgi:hypothetical protein
MLIIDDMLLEISEYLSDYDTHNLLSYLNKKYLLQYYYLKNCYDISLLERPSSAKFMKLKLFDENNFTPKINFPNTITHFNYELGLETITKLPEFNNHRNVTFNISFYCKHCNYDFTHLPARTEHLYLQFFNTNDISSKLMLRHLKHLKTLLICNGWAEFDLNNLPDSLERLELDLEDQENMKGFTLPPNLKRFKLEYLSLFDTPIQLNNSLEYLDLNYYGDMSEFPQTLVELRLENLELTRNCLEHLTNLKVLTLDYRVDGYDDTFDYDMILPPSITELTCNYRFYENLFRENLFRENLFRENLFRENLFRADYDQRFYLKAQLPKNIEKICIRYRLSTDQRHYNLVDKILVNINIPKLKTLEIHMYVNVPSWIHLTEPDSDDDEEEVARIQKKNQDQLDEGTKLWNEYKQKIKYPIIVSITDKALPFFPAFIPEIILSDHILENVNYKIIFDS